VEAAAVGTVVVDTGVWAEFLASKMAVFALVVLVILCVIAVLAPWIAPQNPYDLSVIDVREGRQPPGSIKRTKSQSVSVAAIATGIVNAESEFVISPARESDQRLAGDVSISLTPESDDPLKWRLNITVGPDSALYPLTKVSVNGLPRKAKLSAGKKQRFRNRWTFEKGDLSALSMVLTRPTKKLRLKVLLAGGSQKALMTYWLGTDDQGRDMLSAIIYGLRISLGVALVSVVVAVSLGTLIGLYAAFIGGRFDTVVMRIVDLQLSFPTILVALILLAALGKGIGNVVLALIIVQWAFYARTTRGIALVERRKEYVEAAMSLSLSTLRIIVRHILPNCLPSLIVVATLQVGSAITLEATLSFLGLGLPVTEPSLGLLISNGFEYLLSGYPWISIMPGIALLVTVVSINLVGDELRDVLNPRLRR
jgi:peptide/nickel transport system permease protein